MKDPEPTCWLTLTAIEPEDWGDVPVQRNVAIHVWGSALDYLDVLSGAMAEGSNWIAVDPVKHDGTFDDTGAGRMGRGDQILVSCVHIVYIEPAFPVVEGCSLKYSRELVKRAKEEAG